MDRAEQAAKVIARLRDPLGVRAWMLAPESDDYVRDGYAPRGVDFRDFCVIWKDGSLHAFVHDMRLNQHSRTLGQGLGIAHVVSKNLADWEVLPHALFADFGRWDGRGPFAPNVIEHEGKYYMFYSGWSITYCQSIGLATSGDLIKWERFPSNPVVSPANCPWCHWSRTGLADCRDAHVLRLADRWVIYYTALCVDGDVCVAAAESKNLYDWRDLGPVIRFLPETIDVSPLCLESSFVHPVAGRYVLSYSFDNAIWLNFSDDPVRFNPAGSFITLRGHLALEKVLELDKAGKRWLVAYFNRIEKDRPSKLRFGVLDFNEDRPQVKPVTSRDEMARVLASASCSTTARCSATGSPKRCDRSSK